MMRLLSAWVLVNGVLLAPAWLGAALRGGPWPPLLSVEAALIAGAMALLPRRTWSRALAWGVAVAIVLLGLGAFGDLVFRESLGRPLDLSLDLYLVDAVYRLAVGNAGLARTLLGIAGLAVLAGSLVAAIGWLLTPLPSAPAGPKPAAGIAAGTLALALAGAIAEPVGRVVAAPAASFVAEQVSLARTSRAERVAFASELEAEPAAFADVPGLLSSLEGRHVVLAYIESYGMAALEDPELAAVVRPRLARAAERLDSAGLHLVSGMLESPTLGGQSWYAHGTMISGLWLENQVRYELLLASERETLVHDFRRAGWRTATVMPAITTPWPEAVRLGWDDVYTSRNIPYEGPPFYWVTMPDQYTWAFLEGLLRSTNGPLFAEVGMVSSHAPWVPVLPLLPWDSIGDGSVFEPYRLEGFPPEELWWDVEQLREGYAHSLAYSLDAMAGFAERLDEGTLLIVAGDHQAAPWVTGAGNADVPVHVVAADPALLEPFRAWGFQPGPLPAAQRPARRMDEFRAWFVRAFSDAKAQ
jgi:hypothetical protein